MSHVSLSLSCSLSLALSLAHSLTRSLSHHPVYYNVVSPKKPFQFEAANEQDRVEWQTALRFTLEGLPLPIFREVDGQRVWDPIASLTAEQVSILDDFRTQVHAHLAAVRLVLLRASRVSPNALCFVGGTLFSLLFAG